MTTTPGRPDTEAGVATIWAAAVVAVLVGLLVVGVAVAGAVAARHRAEAAVDLAALAAASYAVHGTETACERARHIARRMGAEITTCRFDGWNALVTTRVRIDVPVVGSSWVEGRARAGAASSTQPT